MGCGLNVLQQKIRKANLPEFGMPCPLVKATFVIAVVAVAVVIVAVLAAFVVVFVAVAVVLVVADAAAAVTTNVVTAVCVLLFMAFCPFLGCVFVNSVPVVAPLRLDTLRSVPCICFGGNSIQQEYSRPASPV